MNKQYFFSLIAVGALLLASYQAQATKGIISDEADPHYSSLANQETVEDMRFNVLGGSVRIDRIWNGSMWLWNERWNNLKINTGSGAKSYGTSSGGPLPQGVGYAGDVEIPANTDKYLIVYRGGQLYRQSVKTEEKTVFENQLYQFITKTADGFEWTDRNGNGIRYDLKGVMTSYYDRNKVNVYLERDTNGYISTVKDHHYNTVLTYTWEPIPGATALTNSQNQTFIPQRLIKLTDYTGRSVSYSWNTANLLEKVTDVRGEVWAYTYDNGALTQLKDPEGRITRYNILKSGKFISRLDADGRGVSFTYNYDKDKALYYAAKKYGDGRLEETWFNPLGQVERETQNGDEQDSVSYILSDNSSGVANLVAQYSSKAIYWYRGDTLVNIDLPPEGLPIHPDAKNNHVYIKIKKVKDPQGNVTVHEYDLWKNELKVTYPDGTSISRTWHKSLGLPLTQTDEKGIITAYEYDANGNLITLTEAKGTADQRITRYTYDEFGQLKTHTTGESSANNTALATTTYDYDQYGNVTQVTNAENHITKFSDYDALGNARTQTDARATPLATNAQYTWAKTFDAAGDLLSSLDPYGKGTTYAYSKSGDLRSITTPEGSTVTITNNASGLPLIVTDLNNKAARMEYDKDNRPTVVIDSNGNKTQLVYDAQGRELKTIDGENNATQFNYTDNKLHSIQYPTYTELMDYDGRDRIKQTTQQANSRNYIRKRGYDKTGNLETSTDALENANTYVYDSFNRVTQMTDANNGVTHFTYDARDNLLQVKDPENRLTIYTYNKNNQWLTETKDGDQNTTRKRVYTYDENGNLKTATNPDQEKTVYEYDQANRLIKTKLYAHKDHSQPIKVVTYSINEKTQLAGWSQQVSSSLPENVTPTNDVISLSETYTYTNLGQLESVTANFGGITKTYSYSYYPNGLKKTYTNPENITYTYYYNKNNQLIAVHIPNNGQITYSDFDWLMPQTLMLPGGQKITYSYTDFLQVKERILKNASDLSLANALYEYDAENNIKKITAKDGNYNFSYDNLYRLKTTDVPVTNPANDEAFGYDDVGNRTDHTTQAGQTSTAETLSYNNKNQLTQSTAANNNDTVFTYTNSGHTKTQTQNSIVTEYVYNHEERLIAVKKNSVVIAEYAYNPQGQRVKKTANGSTTYYLYNENGLAAEYTSSGQLIKEYQFHPQKTWMTDPLFMRTAAGDVYYYHNDHLGTPQQLIDGAGTVVWQAQYSAFGKANITVSAVENNLRFPGQYFDEETGLHQNYFRDYDPELGRYIESDPIGLMGGINTYTYGLQNSMRYSDPTGKVVPVVVIVTVELALAVARAIRYVCARNPAVCKELIKCFKNPKSCKDKFCKKKPNRSYHGEGGKDGFCDVGGCLPTDGKGTVQIKLFAAESCIAMRQFVANVCFSGVMNTTHQREYDEAKKKAKNCRTICPGG